MHQITDVSNLQLQLWKWWILTPATVVSWTKQLGSRFKSHCAKYALGFLRAALAWLSSNQFAPSSEATPLAANTESPDLWIHFTFIPPSFAPNRSLGYTHLHERLFGQLWCLKRNSTFQVGSDRISKSVPETWGAFHSIPTSSHYQVPAGEWASRTERAGRPHWEEK